MEGQGEEEDSNLELGDKLCTGDNQGESGRNKKEVGDSMDKVGRVSERLDNMVPFMVDGYKRNIWRKRKSIEEEIAMAEKNKKFYFHDVVDVVNPLVYNEPTTRTKRLKKERTTEAQWTNMGRKTTTKEKKSQ